MAGGSESNGVVVSGPEWRSGKAARRLRRDEPRRDGPRRDGRHRVGWNRSEWCCVRRRSGGRHSRGGWRRVGGWRRCSGWSGGWSCEAWRHDGRQRDSCLLRGTPGSVAPEPACWVTSRQVASRWAAARWAGDDGSWMNDSSLSPARPRSAVARAVPGLQDSRLLLLRKRGDGLARVPRLQLGVADVLRDPLVTNGSFGVYPHGLLHPLLRLDAPLRHRASRATCSALLAATQVADASDLQRRHRLLNPPGLGGGRSGREVALRRA